MAIIARAREAQQDAFAAQTVEIADEATTEDWNVAKLRIWARQWHASKLAPKKYGTEHVKTENTSAVEMKVSADWSKLSPEEAATMVRLAEKAKADG